MDRYDAVIIGGGSAGCVLANRLSAHPGTRVALLEAGPDTPPGAVPPEILDSYPMPVFCGRRWIWPALKASPTRGAGARVYEQGRVMGGSSSINVQAANRGLPRDYDAWAADGLQGWAWDDVLPYFRKLERDLDYPRDALHGADGPIPIRRIGAHDWPTFCVEVARGMAGQGLPALRDQNAEFGDGYFPAAFSNENGQRVSAAAGYLDARVRQRPNLDLRAGVRVSHLVMEGRQARGVVAIDADGQTIRLEAAEVIICAGALQSPALLLRSGIGDGADLQRLGIGSLLHLPGVGRNLQDHPALTFCHFLGRRLRAPRSQRRASMLAARLSSGVPDCEASDLYLSTATRAAWHALGSRLGLFFLWCNRPYSRGQVRLASADPDAAPHVDLNLLDDPRDLARMAAGVRRLAGIAAASGLGGDERDFFPAVFSARVKALSLYNPLNAGLASAIGALLDAPAPLRRALLGRFFNGGRGMSALLRDDAALAAFVKHHVFGVWHASGTCRMGAANDPWAVTDEQGRVRGAAGLRVVDASLIPRLPSGNTNIPTIMIAEKIAAAMTGTAPR